jgi:Laminin G domain
LSLADKTATQVSVFDGEAYLEYDRTFVARKLLSIFVKFKPEEINGLLVYRHHGANDTTASRNDTVMIRLEGAQVEMYVQYAGVATSMRGHEVLEMGKWHNIFAAVIGTKLVLRTNNGIPMETKFDNLEMEKVDLDQQMFVGGLSEAFTSTTSISHPGRVKQNGREGEC